MGRYSPFSFKGEIGRTELWLTTIAADIALALLGFLPVEQHSISLNVTGSWGESTVGYATALEPITLQSELFLAVFYVSQIAIFWIVGATYVKRLHDLGYSGKWLLLILASIALFSTVSLAIYSRGATSIPLEIVKLVALLPAGLVGGYFMISMYLVRGDSGQRLRPANDMRNALP
jgi:uncharacterized membrane protein YhaH (DUF805 family)